MIAALYVARGGCYFGLYGVDLWPEDRDARLYDGPHAVVGHPPCQRWGRYWFGGPTWVAKGNPRKVKGDDGGCFAAALAAVRRFGGVLEHPEASSAWATFGLAAPRSGRRAAWSPGAGRRDGAPYSSPGVATSGSARGTFRGRRTTPCCTRTKSRRAPSTPRRRARE